MCLTICATCFRKLEGKIVFQDDKVFLLKRCPEHGAERVLVADDVDYYRRCREVSPEARNSDFTRAFARFALMSAPGVGASRDRGTQSRES